MNRVRDKEIYDHLCGTVYTKEHFAVLRLVLTLSKRACALMHQSFKQSRRCAVRRGGITILASMLLEHLRFSFTI